MNRKKLAKKVIKIFLVIIAAFSLLFFMLFLCGAIIAQRQANRALIRDIEKHISGNSVENYESIKNFCTAQTFCIINDFYPTGYIINYRDKPSECAFADIDYFKGFSSSFGSCG